MAAQHAALTRARLHARVADHEVGGAGVLVQQQRARAQLQGLLDARRLAGAAAGVVGAEGARVAACSAPPAKVLVRMAFRRLPCSSYRYYLLT